MHENENDMLVAAPERWDEACFVVPVLRALMASGLGVGVLCREEQQPFWETVSGLRVVAVAANARARVSSKSARSRPRGTRDSTVGGRGGLRCMASSLNGAQGYRGGS